MTKVQGTKNYDIYDYSVLSGAVSGPIVYAFDSQYRLNEGKQLVP